MAKSQKLLIAVALLAGGYGLALVWNATANFFWPNAPLSVGADDRAAIPLAPGTATNGVRLVPASLVDHSAEPNPAASGTASSVASNTPSVSSAAQGPTWLSAGPPAKVVSVTADSSVELGRQGSDDGRAKVASNGLPAGTNDERDIRTVTPFPSAQITAVKPIDDSAAADASPWDRWPRWEPAITVSSAVAPAVSVEPAGGPANRVVTAADQQAAAPLPGPTAIQASFSATAPAGNPLRSSNRLVPVSQPLAEADGEDTEPRTHTIVDGDSLAKLAERFLGDPQLSDRIYQLNRDVLTNPDLLPIGVELKLPPRQTLATNRSLPAPNAASAANANPPGLVAVEDIRKAFVGMPRAQLLRPLPPVEASQSPAIPAAFAASGH